MTPDPLKQCDRCDRVYDAGLVHTCTKEDIVLFKQKKMEIPIKDKLRGVGKIIDDSFAKVTGSIKEKSKEATKSMAKAAAKKTAQGAAKIVETIGTNVENKMKEYSEKIKSDIGIKREMTPGQKAGVVTGFVVQKTVDTIAKGINKLAEKMDERQAKRFATPQELRMEGHDILIGEGLDKAITIDRAERCKLFIKKLKDKKVLPYQLKDIRTELINDAIRGANTSFQGLLNYLKTKKGLETESIAEVNFIKKQIDVVKKKKMEEENGTGDN